MAVQRRIVVVGTSGSGKSTLARQISRRLDIPYIELDAIHHQANWTPMAAPEFRAAVAERIAGDGWVVDGNYRGKLADLVWRRADTVAWFDLPRSLVMRQIVRRTVGRVLTGRELWNGNRERWREMISLDPARSVIVWAWTTHAKNRANYSAAQKDPAFRHLTFVRLGSHREAAAFLDGLACAPPSA
ncbi:P-loop NTPase family protein [Nocardia fluminea]|uniref:shikimate kinase n=1 Tax=Nocardia fluminea TaxID=134984 RepID=UPI001B804DF8|nr:shikimate kinase [Nocardia fluminea]